MLAKVNATRRQEYVVRAGIMASLRCPVKRFWTIRMTFVPDNLMPVLASMVRYSNGVLRA